MAGDGSGTYPVIGGGDASKRPVAGVLSSTDGACPDGYDPLVWQARVDLAACYHLCDQMDMNEGICNHLTVMVPGTTDRFLCIPYGLLWTEVTASNLLLLDDAGNVLEGEGTIDATAFFIHKAIHKTGVTCVLHTHQPYATALCCTKGFRLRMCHQNSLRFFDEVAYDPVFNGLVLDDKEGDRLVEVMGGKSVLFHANHGIIVCGPSVAEAFDDMYYLERCCKVQILAMSSGEDLNIVPDDIAKKFKEDCASDGGKAHWAKLHFDALKRGLTRGPGRIFRE
jgi:ribulose-5-phosphate 4-epimerase/fuculose-1-phosphate aldolase